MWKLLYCCGCKSMSIREKTTTLILVFLVHLVHHFINRCLFLYTALQLLFFKCHLFNSTLLRVRVTLQLTVSQSVCLGVEPNLGLLTRDLTSFFFKLLSCHLGAPSLTRGRICHLSVFVNKVYSGRNVLLVKMETKSASRCIARTSAEYHSCGRFPEFDSTSNRNEYHESSRKLKGGRIRPSVG
jgi:hypothetical protein